MGLSELKPFSIGRFRLDVPVILAPMAGVSEAPFRQLALSFGAGLAPTELVSAKGLELSGSRSRAYLVHDAKKEQPFSVQLFGGDAACVAKGAEDCVRLGAQIIDINMGCPVKKVTKSQAGSALMCDPVRAASIVRAVRERLGGEVPVTAKIRAGWDEQSINAPEFARVLEDAGLSALAIHPRTRSQGYSGRSDWKLIRRVVESVSIPVIANGDVASEGDADRVVEETGCAAVMIGRAALGNPWIFARFLARFRGEARPEAPSASERAALIQRHLAAHLAHVEDEPRAMKKFRAHLIWYSRGLAGGAAFREVAVRVETLAETQDRVAQFFERAEVLPAEEAPLVDLRSAFG